ncbi:hypothetical protein [Methylobacterium tarhaniae]|uniref:hypothetical protein n=1 Tax=Methylobacterium tarhaniae TaxID=1187852 RepID=UPI000A6EC983|nr:hypothetical protein [Methylobacterium tarhaniae]
MNPIPHLRRDVLAGAMRAAGLRAGTGGGVIAARPPVRSSSGSEAAVYRVPPAPGILPALDALPAEDRTVQARLSGALPSVDALSR